MPPRGGSISGDGQTLGTGVVLGEPGCAQEKEEGETALGLDAEKDFSPETTETWSTKVEQVWLRPNGGRQIFVCKAKKLAAEPACKPHTRSSMSVM